MAIKVNNYPDLPKSAIVLAEITSHSIPPGISTLIADLDVSYVSKIMAQGIGPAAFTLSYQPKTPSGSMNAHPTRISFFTISSPDSSQTSLPTDIRGLKIDIVADNQTGATNSYNIFILGTRSA